MSSKLTVARYEKNPFLADMVVPMKGRSVRLSPLGKDENILVNQTTGEVFGTHITTVRRVDADQFVKLFTANIALTFDLGAAGIKSFNVLVWAVQHSSIGKDQVDLDSFTLTDFLAAHDGRQPSITLSQATMKRGLRELERAKIVARTMRPGRYFINPNFVFNGDRIAFTTLIERKEKSGENQIDWCEE